MTPYRFSPIQNKTQLIYAIKHIHVACHALCAQLFGTYLPVAGNIGIFCHFDDEYVRLTEIQQEITDESKSVYGKYFQLYQPFVIAAKDDVPQTIYTHLYIRKPDPQKPQVGDLDFFLEPQKYASLKQSLMQGGTHKGMRMLNRPDLDLVELYDPNIDALGYIGDKQWFVSA